MTTVSEELVSLLIGGIGTDTAVFVLDVLIPVDGWQDQFHVKNTHRDVGCMPSSAAAVFCLGVASYWPSDALV